MCADTFVACHVVFVLLVPIKTFYTLQTVNTRTYPLPYSTTKTLTQNRLQSFKQYRHKSNLNIPYFTAISGVEKCRIDSNRLSHKTHFPGFPRTLGKRGGGIKVGCRIGCLPRLTSAVSASKDFRFEFGGAKGTNVQSCERGKEGNYFAFFYIQSTGTNCARIDAEMF